MNKERLFPIEQIIAQKQYVSHAKHDLAVVQKNFFDQTPENFPYPERKKTEQEKKILRAIDKITSARLAHDGAEPFSVSPDHVHIVSDEDAAALTGLESRGAAYMPYHQSIVLNESGNLIEFAVRAYHEMTHFKSFQLLQIPKDKNSELVEYRIGLLARSRDGEYLYFSNLNEAITDELAKRFLMTEVPHIPALAAQYASQKDRIQALSDVDDSFNPDEVVFLGPGKDGEEVVATMNYLIPRQILNTLIDKLYALNAKDFQDREGVFDLFAKAANTGHMLPIVRLIEHTFGKGAFRKLGELDQDVDALKAYVDSL